VAETAGYARGINKLESRLYPQPITPVIQKPVLSTKSINSSNAINVVSSRIF
jgi:hypothetical protein